MTLVVLTIIAMTIGAVAIAIIDRALGPDNETFPCAHPAMHWALRFYSIAIFNRAALMAGGALNGSVQSVGIDVAFEAVCLAMTHSVLLFLLLRARSPAGVWARIQRRIGHQFGSIRAQHLRHRHF